MASSPLTNTSTLRERARSHVEEGAITSSYHADRGMVLQLLNQALATEIVCSLRYRLHFFTVKGLSSEGAATEFQEHATQELEHADRIAARIVQLGGKPNFSPAGMLERSHAEYVAVDSLVGMLRENLVAERIAIESYTEMINYIGDNDPTTRRLLEEILAVEEEHAEDLVSLLEGNVG